MHPARLANQLLTYCRKRKTKSPWLVDVSKDLQEIGGMEEDLKYRTILRRMLKRMRFQDEPPGKKTTAFCTEERKE